MRKKRRKKNCILKVTEESSRIRSWIWIRIRESDVGISRSAQKCHGSPTLLCKNIRRFFHEGKWAHRSAGGRWWGSRAARRAAWRSWRTGRSTAGDTTATDRKPGTSTCLQGCRAASVADPIFFVGPPGSESTSTRYGSGSGSGSFCKKKIGIKKNLIPTVLWLLYESFKK